MKISRRKLRRTLRESIRSVLSESTSHPEKGECPSIYEWEKLYNLTKTMRVSGRGEPTTAYLKAWNRYKKKGMNIPGMLYDETPECAYAVITAARTEAMMFAKVFPIKIVDSNRLGLLSILCIR